MVVIFPEFVLDDFVGERERLLGDAGVVVVGVVGEFGFHYFY